MTKKTQLFVSNPFVIFHPNYLSNHIACFNYHQNAFDLTSNQKKNIEQAGTELGQAQLKLRLYYALIIFRFGFSRFSLLNFVG